MKRITWQNLLQYILPLTLILFMQVTIKWSVTNEDGGYDRLWGLPFGFISGNIGCTGCYVIYVLPMFLDLSLKFTLAIIVFNLVEKWLLKLKTHWLGILLGCLISIFWLSFFYMIISDSHFELINDFSYKIVSWEFCWGLHNGIESI